MIDLPNAYLSIAKSLKGSDTDRYLASLFAPQPQRRALQALYAFDKEIRSIPDRVSEPLLGEIRLQWWREAIEEIFECAEPRAHEGVVVLSETIRKLSLPRERFDRMIDARAFDLYDEPLADWQSFEAYANKTEMPLYGLASQILCPGTEIPSQVLDLCGEVSALLNALRIKILGQTHRQSALPKDVSIEEGLDRLSQRQKEVERATRDLPKDVFPAVLPLCLVDRYASGLEAYANDPSHLNLTGLAKRLKFLKHSFLGRI